MIKSSTSSSWPTENNCAVPVLPADAYELLRNALNAVPFGVLTVSNIACCTISQFFFCSTLIGSAVFNGSVMTRSSRMLALSSLGRFLTP